MWKQPKESLDSLAAPGHPGMEAGPELPAARHQARCASSLSVLPAKEKILFSKGGGLGHGVPEAGRARQGLENQNEDLMSEHCPRLTRDGSKQKLSKKNPPQ